MTTATNSPTGSTTDPTQTLTRRPAGQRGHFDHGWLDTSHTFSFAGYHDPAHMGFRSLRVINEDRVAAGRGFGTHGHQNMEIVTLVLDGQLEHKDSMGNGEVLVPGDVQYMSAASGVRHSEFNPDPDRPVHFYQIWIEPEQTGGEPLYSQTKVDLSPAAAGQTKVVPIIGGRHELQMRQDASIEYASVAAGQTLALPQTHPHQWIQVVTGGGTVVAGEESLDLATSDGLAVSHAGDVQLTAGDVGLNVLVFNLS